MRCPKDECKGKSEVPITEKTPKVIKRVRRCLDCNLMFLTYEPMACPECGADGLKSSVPGGTREVLSIVYRRRQCGHCGNPYSTYEQVVAVMSYILDPAKLGGVNSDLIGECHAQAG